MPYLETYITLAYIARRLMPFHAYTVLYSTDRTDAIFTLVWFSFGTVFLLINFALKVAAMCVPFFVAAFWSHRS